MTLRSLVLSAAIVLATAVPSSATGDILNVITGADNERLQNYDKTREEALKEAHDRTADDQTAVLDQVVSAEPMSWQGFEMTGEWRCRTIKAGGLAQLVVYGWFKCRVTDDGSGWTLEKLTGSQKTKGRFFDDGDKRLTYLGSFAVNADPFPKYGSGPDSDQTGYAFRTGQNSFRIEFPAPRYESKLDILEFAR